MTKTSDSQGIAKEHGLIGSLPKGTFHKQLLLLILLLCEIIDITYLAQWFHFCFDSVLISPLSQLKNHYCQFPMAALEVSCLSGYYFRKLEGQPDTNRSPLHQDHVTQDQLRRMGWLEEEED